MTAADFKNLPVLVLGLGLHGGGVAVTRWLLKQGARVTVTDLKNRLELIESLRAIGPASYNLVLGAHPLSLLKSGRLIVQNPGVPSDLSLLKAARRRHIPIENEASLFLKLCPARQLAAVTGSKGKSTVTSLLGQMVKAWRPGTRVAGNIRDTVMFDVLTKIKPTTPVVLELSSWQLEQVGKHKLRLPLAIITNVLPDHLNRYHSMADYTAAKAQIFRWQKPGDRLILNYDNLITRSLARHAAAQVYWFSTRHRVSPGIWLSRGQVYISGQNAVKKIFSARNLQIPGEHNLANALAASLAAYLMGVPLSVIARVACKFTGLHDRLQLVRKWHDLEFYNDTAATAPAAAAAAMAALPRHNLTLIAGGVDKKLTYGHLASLIKQLKVRLVLLPGTATVKLQTALRGYQPIVLAESMAAAVKLAVKLTPPGGTVLLSPGAASFNLFKHEFDRGAQFAKLVKNLK